LHRAQEEQRKMLLGAVVANNDVMWQSPVAPVESIAVEPVVIGSLNAADHMTEHRKAASLDMGHAESALADFERTLATFEEDLQAIRKGQLLPTRSQS